MPIPRPSSMEFLAELSWDVSLAEFDNRYESGKQMWKLQQKQSIEIHEYNFRNRGFEYDSLPVEHDFLDMDEESLVDRDNEKESAKKKKKKLKTSIISF